MISQELQNQLVQGLISNSRESQRALFLTYFPLVKSITLRYAKMEEDSEELVNDAFLKAFFGIKSFDQTKSFSAWLSRITVNVCIDKYRSTLKNKDFHRVEISDDLLGSYEPDLQLDNSIEILPIIRELPERYRLVFNLYVFEEYSHREIAEALKIKEGTSKSCLCRAKQIIKQHFENKATLESISHG